MEHCLISYFEALFSLAVHTDRELDLSDLELGYLSKSQRGILVRPVQDKEIDTKLMEIYPTKAPGPYGFSAQFY